MLTVVTFARALIACLLLAALTLGIAQSPWRFAKEETLPFNHASFAQGFVRYASEVPQDEALRLPAKDAGPRYVAQVFAPPTQERAVTVLVEASTSDLVLGDHPLSLVSVMLFAVNADGQPMWWLPRELGRFDETSNWQTVSLTLPNTVDAKYLALVAYNNAVSGTLNLRKVEVWRSAERGIFAAGRYVLILLWLMLGVMLLIALLKDRLTLLTLAAGGVAIALLILGVAPQPHMSNHLRTAFYAAQDLFIPPPTAPWEDSDAPQSEPPTAAAESGDTSRQAPATAPEPPRGEQAPQAEEESDSPAMTESDEDESISESISTRTYWRPTLLRSDKSQHTLAFGVLTFIATVAWRRRYLQVALACVTLSASLQAIQSLTVTRQPDGLDFAHDLYGVIAGLVCGVGLAFIVERLQRLRTAVRS